MFANKFKKMSELYDAYEKSHYERLNKFSEAVNANANTIKQLTNWTRDPAESLIVNQDFIEEQITTVKNKLKEIKKKVKANRTELKEQMRIQKDRSRRNNIRVDSIEEDENVTWLTPRSNFLYDELEIVDNVYIERAQRNN